MLADDPEAPTTTDRFFDYGPKTGGPVAGPSSSTPARSRTSTRAPPGPVTPAASAPPRRQASNWLIASPQRSLSGNSLAVMGPQLGYYYPEIVQQIHLEGRGSTAQGIAVPGLAMYVLIGRTENYAWSLTSAGHDVRDVFAEQLCNADGSPATRASTSYVYGGQCRPFQTVDGRYSVGSRSASSSRLHGQVVGTATVGGKPYALARKRSTYGRDALNLGALKDMTEARRAIRRRSTGSPTSSASRSTGATSRAARPRSSRRGACRARPGLDRRLPTLGNGDYEWRGFLRRLQHPHDEGGPDGLLMNWNNRSARGFMHGDDEPYGSAQRVELFDKCRQGQDRERRRHHEPRRDGGRALARVADHQPRPASPAGPGRPRRARRADPRRLGRARRAAGGRGQRRPLGRRGSGDPRQPVAAARRRGHEPGVRAACSRPRRRPRPGWPVRHSYVDKDLRTLLGDPVRGRFHLRYCGNGSLPACRASLWRRSTRRPTHLAASARTRPDGLAAAGGGARASRVSTFNTRSLPENPGPVRNGPNRPNVFQAGVLESSSTRSERGTGGARGAGRARPSVRLHSAGRVPASFPARSSGPAAGGVELVRNPRRRRHAIAGWPAERRAPARWRDRFGTGTAAERACGSADEDTSACLR
jgi:hypothetical protein